MSMGLHVGEVVIIEDSRAVFLDIVGPNRSLREGLAAAISEGVEGDDEGVELVAGCGLLGVGEVVIGDLGDQHVSLVPPGVGKQEGEGEAEQSVEPHVIIRGNY